MKAASRKQLAQKLGTRMGDVALGEQVTAPGGTGSTTWIELYAEGYLARNGASYETQVELGLSRIDHVVNVDGHGIALRMNGDHWHANVEGHDLGKAQQLVGMTTANGTVIEKVIDVRESDLVNYGELPLEMALRGEAMNPLW